LVTDEFGYFDAAEFFLSRISSTLFPNFYLMTKIDNYHFLLTFKMTLSFTWL